MSWGDSTKAILFDLDGVLYVGKTMIPGAAEALDFVRERGIPCCFITNTTTKTVHEVAEKLRGFGFGIPDESIFSAITATRDFLREQGNPSVDLLVRDSVKPEFAEFPQGSATPDYVVVGDIGAAWDYPLMNRVFNELMNGAKLLAMHKTRYWQTEEGLCMDIGGFVAGFEYVSGQEALIMGKPSRSFFEFARKSLGVDAGEVMMIGDDIENDVGGGQAAGFKGVLVKTGKFRPQVLEASEVDPDAILASIADLPNLLTS